MKRDGFMSSSKMNEELEERNDVTIVELKETLDKLTAEGNGDSVHQYTL